MGKKKEKEYKIDYVNHPQKSFYELLHTYQPGKPLILDDVLGSQKRYVEVFQDMVDTLKYGVEHRNIRERPINFYIHEDEYDREKPLDNLHVLELRHFLSNLCLWRAFVTMERVDVMDERFIMDWKDKKAEDIAKYIDRYVIPYQDEYGDEGFHTLNAVTADVIYDVKAISDAFGLILAFGASIYDIMRIEESDPRIHELMYAEIDPNQQPKALEDELKARNEELMMHFGRHDPDTVPSDLAPLLMSGKNISANQFKEIFLCIGFKADMSSRTIPWFLYANLLMTGLYKPSYFAINQQSGRRAQMNSKLKMSKPGAMSKKVNHNATPVILRKDNEVCDSTRPVVYEVEDEAFLRMLDKRYYYDDENGGQLTLLDGERDHHLIGKRIRFRSPCTCTSTEGVCRACYGELFKINKDLFSQGSLASTKTTEGVGQSVLSEKHTQFTQSDEISFSDDFYQVFDIASSEITLNDNSESSANLLIQLGPVTTEETDEGEVYRIDFFDLVDYDGVIIAHIKEEHDFPIYLANEMITAYKQCAGHPIPIMRFDDLDDDVPLFNIEVKSKAVTQTLQLMLAALDSKDHMGCSRDIDGLLQKFGRIMVDAGTMYPFVHYEMIIKSLLRKVGKELEYPDFGPNGDHDDYEILRLTWSLRKNPSPVIRLSTGWLKSSLISHTLYESTAPSHFDALLVPNLNDVI